jgi:tRNA-splicing ligase RtcB
MPNADKIKSLIPMNEIEQGAQQQIYDNANIPFVKTIAVMPDCHQGYDLPIGAVALVEDHISPSYVGYDIGCGMICYEIPQSDINGFNQADRVEVFNLIKEKIPVGFTEHDNPYPEQFRSQSNDKELTDKVNAKTAKQHGTLGGGNHFIEIGYNAKGTVFITIHSGSRRPGWEIAQWYMNEAKKDNQLYHKFFELYSDLGRAYLADMNFALKFALDNRKHMLKEVVKIMVGHNATLFNYINENHNHATVLDNGDVLHRKGATPARLHELGVIPGSMLSGVYITEGLGNAEYLNSASHGAGRKMSRGAAKKNITLDTFKAQMDGIFANVDATTLDEAPDAYKDLSYVMAAQDGIVIKTIDYIKPIINIKG